MGLGRGGAGNIDSPFGPTGNLNARLPFSCKPNTYDRAGNLNSTGGRGADAGDVHITLIGSPDEPTIQKIRNLVSVRGGLPGSTRKLRAPSATTATTTSACTFLPEGEWTSSPAGAAGTATVAPATSTAAMVDFINRLSVKDGTLEYDLLDVVNRLDAREMVPAMEFTTFAKDRFIAQLEETESALLEQLNQELSGVPISPSPLPQHLYDLDRSQLDAGLFANPIVQPLSDLTKFQPRPNHSPVFSYFMNTGGIFRLQDARIATTWSALALRAEEALVIPKLDEVKKQLAQTNIVLSSIAQVLWTVEYQSRLAGLRATLAESERRLAEHSGDAQLLKVAAAIKEIADGAAAAYVGFQSGNAAAGFAGIQKAARGRENLADAVKSNRPAIDKIEALRAAIESVEAEFKAFSESTAAAQQKFLAQYNAALFDFFASRRAALERASTRGHLFHDLLRAGVLSFLADPFRNQQDLVQNLRNLNALIRRYPMSEPFFRFADLTDPCPQLPADDPRCFWVPPSTSSRVLTINSPKWYGALPAYVLAPSQGDIVVRTFGEKLEVGAAETGKSDNKSIEYTPLDPFK